MHWPNYNNERFEGHIAPCSQTYAEALTAMHGLQANQSVKR